MTSIAIPVTGGKLFRVRDEVNTINNNCEKLLFIYSEITRLKQELIANSKTIRLTYRQIKRQGTLGVSQYLLDMAEKIVPKILRLPEKVRKILCERGAKWSIMALESAMALPIEGLMKILNTYVKPTVNYISQVRSEISAVPHKNCRFLIPDNYWSALAQTYEIKESQITFLKRKFKVGLVKDLFDYLIELGFELKKLNVYQELKKNNDQNGGNMSRTKGPLHVMNLQDSDASYIHYCLESALKKAGESKLKTFSDFASLIESVSQSASSELLKDESGILEAVTFDDDEELRIWYKNGFNRGYTNGSFVEEKMGIEEKRFVRENVEKFLQGLQTQQVTESAVFEATVLTKYEVSSVEEKDVSILSASQLTKPVGKFGEDLSKSYGEVNGINVAGLGVQTLGTVLPLVQNSPPAISKEKLKNILDKFERLKSKHSSVQEKQNDLKGSFEKKMAALKEQKEEHTGPKISSSTPISTYSNTSLQFLSENNMSHQTVTPSWALASYLELCPTVASSSARSYLNQINAVDLIFLKKLITEDLERQLEVPENINNKYALNKFLDSVEKLMEDEKVYDLAWSQTKTLGIVSTQILDVRAAQEIADKTLDTDLYFSQFCDRKCLDCQSKLKSEYGIGKAENKSRVKTSNYSKKVQEYLSNNPQTIEKFEKKYKQEHQEVEKQRKIRREKSLDSDLVLKKDNQQTPKINSLQQPGQQTSSKSKEQPAQQTEVTDNKSNETKNSNDETLTRSQIVNKLTEEINALNHQVANLIEASESPKDIEAMKSDSYFDAHLDKLNKVLDDIENSLNIQETKLNKLKETYEKKLATQTKAEKAAVEQLDLSKIEQVKNDQVSQATQKVEKVEQNLDTLEENQDVVEENRDNLIENTVRIFKAHYQTKTNILSDSEPIKSGLISLEKCQIHGTFSKHKGQAKIEIFQVKQDENGKAIRDKNNKIILGDKSFEVSIDSQGKNSIKLDNLSKDFSQEFLLKLQVLAERRANDLEQKSPQQSQQNNESSSEKEAQLV